MWTHRVSYQFLLLCSLFFYVLYSRWFSWYFLVLVLLLIPFDLILSLPGMLTKRIALSMPKMLRQGADGTLFVVMVQKKWFPSGRIKISLREMSDGKEVFHRLKCDSEKGSRYEMALDTSRSGFTEFDFYRFWATSLLGLFSIPVTAKCRAGVLVLPAPAEPPKNVPLPRVSAARPEQVGVFSEDHDLRPYRRGDPLKSIHWKLSAKHDSLVVREPLLPPPHSRLVRVSRWNGSRERDLVLGRLHWVSNYLLKRELHFYIRFGDGGPVAEITCFGDLVDYLRHVLDSSASVPANAVNPPKRFAWVFHVNADD